VRWHSHPQPSFRRIETMHTIRATTTALLTIATATAFAAQQQAASAAARPSASSTGRSTAKATIVLVHGAFADGSSWQAVIPLLQQDGYKVVAVQNALQSL